MNRRILLLAAAPLAVMLAGGAFAQTTKMGPNGGLLAGTDGHEVELVANGTSVRLYLINHGKVAPPRSGSTARMVIQEGQTTRTANLTASGDAFGATLEAAIARGARVVVTGRMPDGHSVQARYVMP